MLRTLQRLAPLCNAVAVVVFGLTLAAARARGVGGGPLHITVTEWAVLSVAAGAVCGGLFVLFIGGEPDEPRIQLATLGVVIFASGLAAGSGVSPVFVNLVAGATVGALSAHADRLLPALERMRHPVAVVVVIFAGALWRVVPGWLWLIPVGYVLLRHGGLRLGAGLAVRASAALPSAPRMGHGFVAQGALACALAVDAARALPALGPIVLTAALLGLVLNDVWSAWLLRRVLADAGEVGVRGASAEGGG